MEASGRDFEICARSEAALGIVSCLSAAISQILGHYWTYLAGWVACTTAWRDWGDGNSSSCLEGCFQFLPLRPRRLARDACTDRCRTFGGKKELGSLRPCIQQVTVHKQNKYPERSFQEGRHSGHAAILLCNYVSSGTRAHVLFHMQFSV